MERYSEVEYFECSVLGGGIHACTTFNDVLFNLKDLFDLLNLKDKSIRKRWERKIDSRDKEFVNFKREDRVISEAFISYHVVSYILTLYGKEILDEITRKYEVDYLICGILDKYDSKDINNTEKNTLATKFAIESLKIDSEISKNVNTTLLSIIERSNDIRKSEYHISNFRLDEIMDFEQLKKYTEDMDKELDKIIKILSEHEYEKPDNIYTNTSDYSLLIDDFEEDDIED
jgi:hypothetical protein